MDSKLLDFIVEEYYGYIKDKRLRAEINQKIL